MPGDEPMRDALALLAPGTELREAVENILTARSGALIVLGGDGEVDRLLDGGFRVDCPFSAPRLYELAKMDGAVVISEDRRIRFANVHLQPDPSLPTSETGTRHRTAERVARQTGALVIAVSHRRHRVTLYRRDARYVLHDLGLVLAEANQGLQTLGEHRRLLDRELAELTSLELQREATGLDVARTLQRCLTVCRIGEDIQARCLELGAEGRLVELQLTELLSGVEPTLRLLARDYARSREPRLDGRLELTDIAHALGLGPDLDAPLEPRGYRLLARVPRLPAAVAERIVARFGGLRDLLAAGVQELDEVEGVGAARARAVQEQLERLSRDAKARGLPPRPSATPLRP